MMPGAAFKVIVDTLDGQIAAERERRLVVVQEAVKRVFDELLSSVERESALLARRGEVVLAMPEGDRYLRPPSHSEVLLDLGLSAGRRTAAMAIREVLKDAGEDGLRGGELNLKLRPYFSLMSIERAKQRMKINEIEFDKKTRLWSLRKKKHSSKLRD